MISWPNTGEKEGSPNGKAGRILIVHDHVLFRQALAVVLERRAGFDVYAEAATPSEARSLLRTLEDAPDLAVVDLDPHDGGELVRELGGGPSGTSVLGLTSGDGRAAAGTRGVVLTTEASIDEILAVVRRLIR